MRFSRQFQACLLFLIFYEKIWRAQKTLKCKTSDFYSLRSLYKQKIVAFVV